MGLDWATSCSISVPVPLSLPLSLSRDTLVRRFNVLLDEDFAEIRPLPLDPAIARLSSSEVELATLLRLLGFMDRMTVF